MTYLEILEAAWQDHLKPREPDAPTVISTFAGCGGSSLGYSMAGYRELLAVEWNNNAVETFRLNFPEVPVYHGDICKLTVTECLEIAGIQPGELDVFDGSPPCQGFSMAGKRVLDDPRNSLFREYVRLLQGLQPKVLVMENVSGMVKGKMKLVFAEIMRELKASGYRVSARLMNAMYFNVPQSRERMIFIGVREDLARMPSHPKAQKRPPTAGDTIGHLEGQFPIELGKYKPHIYKQWQTGYNPRNGRAGLRVVRPGAYVGSFNSCRIERDRPAPTFVKSHNHWHYSEFRQLQMIEVSLLASFGRSFKWQADYIERIGNSAPPLFMRAIAAYIRREILADQGRAE